VKVEENTKNKMKNPLWKQPGLDRLICVLVASIALFLVQIVMSHITHSLTLLVAAYHMLYNIFSLIGCIATIKVLENYFLHLKRKKRTI
jgi:Co/Zn/Cd efflux system component